MPSNEMGVGTVPFFWIAFYKNKQILPQFDFETGKQNSFKEIDQSNLEKFGWYPFNKVLAKKANDANGTQQYFVKPNMTHYIITLKPNQKLIALRREKQIVFSFSHCFSCGFDWQWMPNKVDGSIGDAGLPRFGSEKYYITLDNKVFEVVCPKCGARNDLQCPQCKIPWNKIDKQYTLQCPKCKKIREKYTQSCSDQLMIETFLLGWKETLSNGSEKYVIMFIDEDGVVTLSDNFNAV